MGFDRNTEDNERILILEQALRDIAYEINQEAEYGDGDIGYLNTWIRNKITKELQVDL